MEQKPKEDRLGARDLAKVADDRAVGQPANAAQSLHFFAMLWRFVARIGSMFGRGG